MVIILVALFSFRDQRLLIVLRYCMRVFTLRYAHLGLNPSSDLARTFTLLEYMERTP